jgi:formate-dependent nitrite reductase membrane component NrfD
LDDPNSEISQLRSRHQVTARKPEKGTLPALYYIDGDVASLNPSATEVTNDSVWSYQTRGVGHYAKFLEDRAAASGSTGSAATKASGQVSVVDTLEKFLSLGDHSSGVLTPSPEQKVALQSQHVAGEVARRTYDAPQKGALWGWHVTAYIWTKAIAAGAVMIPLLAALFGVDGATLGIRTVGVVCGLAFLALTGLLLAADLDQPKRFIYVLLRPQWRSWLVRGAYIITAYGASLALWLLWALARRTSVLLDVVVIGLAIATAVYTAFLLRQAKSRDFWQSPWLSVHMLVHALLAGVAIFMFGLPFVEGSSPWRYFISWLGILLIVTRQTCDLIELRTAHATPDTAKTIELIAKGPYAKLYRNLVQILGGVVPGLFILLLPAWTAPLSAILLLIGIYCSEHIWVRAPQRIPLA